MIVNISNGYLKLLTEQVHYIYKDKPKAAFKFRKEILRNIKKDLRQPFLFQKSRYFDNDNIRDYVYKGYISVFEVDNKKNLVSVFGFIKYKNTL